MKLSLALAPRRQLSRQVAWGCLTTNLALPGSGSLLAGRATGYPQLALTVAGFAMTTIFGIRFILWYLANYHQIQQSDDPGATLEALWLACRWPFLGIALFACAWFWALSTSLIILAGARQDNPPAVPPKIQS
jgi:hypothetical protein